MNAINSAISMAVKTQSKRVNVTNDELAQSAGMSRDAVSRRLNNHTEWKLDELDAIAQTLQLPDAWALIDLAKSEQELSNSRLAA